MSLAAPASPSRRAILAALGATLAAPAALAVGNELDPADVVPRRFSQGAFLSLDANRIYDLRYASRLSRRIIIDGFTASMSHHVIAMAAEDWPAARRLVRDMRDLTGQRRIARLEAELATAENRGEVYLDAVRAWRRAPEQGTH